jgi:hypothetical protein
MPRRRAQREIAPWQAIALKTVLSALLTVVCVLTLAPATRADNQCKPAAPLPQSKCTTDAQCCAGLVCDVNGSTDRFKHCQAGCDIGGVFYASTEANPRNTCQTCQPTVSTTAWTAVCHVVFVTSTTYNANLGGLKGADTKCQTVASAAQLDGTFKAWLSDSTTNASDRLTHATVPYVRVDGTHVAENWTDLTDGTLAAPMVITEQGQTDTTGRAWTGTDESGGSEGEACEGTLHIDWTFGGAGSGDNILGVMGQTTATDCHWTRDAPEGCGSPAVTYSRCDTLGALYCIEQ